VYQQSGTVPEIGRQQVLSYGFFLSYGFNY
jgi:hypothetical protein